MKKQANPSYKKIARNLTCKQCNKNFIFASYDQPYHYSVPNLCPICRRKIAGEKRRQQEELENAEWDRIKKEQHKLFEEQLQPYHVVSLDKIMPCNDKDILYIIGNGFDMMHGVKSSYYSFRDSIGKRNQLRRTLETFLLPDDIWADFERALGQFNVKMMNNADTIDMNLDMWGAYDVDAGAAEYYLAVEMAADPIVTVARELQQYFRRWIETLTIGTSDRPLKSIFRNAHTLCFNYTEFVEMLYDVSKENVCYIHGCRQNKNETLVLGHMPGASDAIYDFEDDRVPTRNRKKQEMVFAAQEDSLRFIIDSDDSLTKYCDKIIEKNEAFFTSLKAIKDIILIGHSMSEVDMDYFCEVANHLDNPDNVNWYIGCHGLRDLENMQSMIRKLNISQEKVFIFRTDLISANFDLVKSNDSEKSIMKKEKIRGISPNKTWRATSVEGILKVYGKHDKEPVFESIFSHPISKAVFSYNEKYMFIIIRGIYSGIFLFAYKEGEWHFVNELESIPHQSLLNRRLRHIYLTESNIAFVYNNRMRKYSLTEGALVENIARRYINGYSYEGVDRKEEFIK